MLIVVLPLLSAAAPELKAPLVRETAPVGIGLLVAPLTEIVTVKGSVFVMVDEDAITVTAGVACWAVSPMVLEVLGA
jgi:hypothetical protein